MRGAFCLARPPCLMAAAMERTGAVRTAFQFGKRFLRSVKAR